MALIATVSKKTVTNPQSKLVIITFNLVVNDGEVTVINQDFTCEFRTGDNVADKASQAIYASASLDSAVTAIQGGLNV